MENKVAKKAIETIDLTQLINLNAIKGFDVKPFLFQGLIVKEKAFRQALKEYDFAKHKDESCFVHCSSDAIIPMWAYMLIAHYFTKNNINFVVANTKEEAINHFVRKAIESFDVSVYENKRVIIKGCSGKIKINEANYMAITNKLNKHVKALSYGEACSMVSIFKN